MYDVLIDIEKSEMSTVINYIGKICQLLAIALLLPIIVALIVNEPHYFLPFGISSLLSFMFGYSLTYKYKVTKPLSIKSAMIFSTVIWIVTCFFSALPFLLAGELSFVDSFFEAMSGFTTTGYSMYPNLDIVSLPIDFWRGLMQWIGGLGIIFIALAIFNSAKGNINNLYISEAREEKIYPSTRSTVKKIIKIYFVATIIGIILLKIAGMPLFDSIFYTFTAIATGGSAMQNTSILHYNNIYIEIVLMLIMIFGATNFVLTYTVIKGKWREYFKDIETKVFYIILIISIIFIWISLEKNSAFGTNWLTNFRFALFQGVSAITTTGLQTTFNPTLSYYWGPLGMFLMTILMVIGGSSGSTAGGIKCLRIGILLKSIYWEVKKYLLPKKTVFKNTIHHIKKVEVSDDQLRLTGIFIFVYIFMFIISTIICLIFYSNLSDVMFDVASALSNVGLSASIITPSSPIIIKILFILDFWIGRLEIWPVLVLGVLLSKELIKFNRSK